MYKILSRNEIKNLLIQDFNWDEEKALAVTDYFLAIEAKKKSNSVLDQFCYERSLFETFIKVVPKEEMNQHFVQLRQNITYIGNYAIIDLQNLPTYSTDEIFEALSDLDDTYYTHIEFDKLEDNVLKIYISCPSLEGKNYSEKKKIVLNHLKEKGIVFTRQLVLFDFL